ncbi:MAG: phosphatase PAP2 family protein [Gammaproteobacteria bacterium]
MSAFALGGCAADARALVRSPSGYVDAKSLGLARLLPPGPANDSAVTRAELDLILNIQQNRTPAEAARAKADAEVSIYRFADALGDPPALEAKNLPLTQALFKRVLATEGDMIGPGKDYFGRPRPFALDARITPVITKPMNPSYPSGHTTWARAVGLILADMIPERRSELLARADEYAFNRVVAGVHYPSDVEAGKLAGTALAALLFASPEFVSDYAGAKKELRKVLALPEVAAQ